MKIIIWAINNSVCMAGAALAEQVCEKWIVNIFTNCVIPSFSLLQIV